MRLPPAINRPRRTGVARDPALYRPGRWHPVALFPGKPAARRPRTRRHRRSVYGLLRNKTVYTNFAESGHGPAMRRLTLLGLADAVGIDSLGGLTEEETAWLHRVGAIDRSLMPAPMRANLPEWLFDKLVAQYGEAETLQLADALNTPAPLDLRVNSLKATREEVDRDAGRGADHGPNRRRMRRSACASLKKPSLQNLPLFKEGAIEVQDEGSQLLAQMLWARKRGEMVVDFCAGAGGKTLALGALMRNTGRLYAFDVSAKRLAKLKPRVARSGLSNVHPVQIAHERDAKVKRLAGKIDRVLVDAPCTGLGTLRRNPGRQVAPDAGRGGGNERKAGAILASAARLVKPGGRLVYAHLQPAGRRERSHRRAVPGQPSEFVAGADEEVLAEQKIALEMGEYLKLLPHKHQTDGFFAAVLTRK